MWLEEYDLLNQDPEIPPKLQGFLFDIVSPPALALTAKHTLRSLERLVSHNSFGSIVSDLVLDVCRAFCARVDCLVFQKMEESAEGRRPRADPHGSVGGGPASLLVRI